MRRALFELEKEFRYWRLLRELFFCFHWFTELFLCVTVVFTQLYRAGVAKFVGKLGTRLVNYGM